MAEGRAVSWRHRRLMGPGGERGSVAAVWLVATTVALVALAALVFDGGRAVAARGDAMSVAQQAARAAADAAAAAGDLQVGGDGIDVAAGMAAAERVISAAGDEITDHQIEVTAEHVAVTVTVTRPTAMLAIVGKTTLSGTATATAMPLAAAGI